MALEWMGDQVQKTAVQAIVSGMNEFGARWETAAKASLKPGRGVVTGTYRRSLHYSGRDYNFAGDNVTPGPSTPERGGAADGATVSGNSVSIVAGSGLVYARRLETMYNVVVGAHEQVVGQLLGILEKHARAAGLT